LKGTPVDPKVTATNVGEYTEEDLEVEELRDMADDSEEPGEVSDLYHKYPPDLTPCSPATTKKRSSKKCSPSTAKEQTPTKSSVGETNNGTPRRSPRLHDQQNMLINVIKINAKDLKDVDHRLDVPKVLVLAHRDAPSGQDVDELRIMLQDLSSRRLKMQFDLCE
jgi:hypothetical protein